MTGPGWGREVTLAQGDVRCGDEGEVLLTVLGSCVAVCLWDARLRIGGMNHFVLPGDPQGRTDTRYGAAAMPAMLAAMQCRGTRPQDLRAHVLGGAAVLPTALGETVGMLNVDFARGWLARLGVRVVGERVGGVRGMQVRFDTASGETYVRRLAAPVPVAA